MNDFAQMLVISKYQFKNYLRSKRLLTLFLITIIIAVIYLLVIYFYMSPGDMDIKNFSSNWSSPVSFLVILSALFFGGDAIAGEYQSKTGYFLFPNPIKRESILWGKYLASLFASAIVILTYWLVAMINIFYYYKEIPEALWYSFGISFLFLISIMALTYLFSTLFKNGTVAIAIVAIIYFFVFNIINSISMLTGMEPWFSITYGASIMTLVFQGNYIGDYPHKEVLQAGQNFTITLYNPYIWEGVAIMLAYFIVSAILATIIFHYKELK